MRVTLDSHEKENVKYLDNGTFGNLYLVGYHTGGNWCAEHWFLTRASSLEEAIDVLVDSDHGKYLRIDADEMADYVDDDTGEPSCQFTGCGTAYDTDWLLIGPDAPIVRVTFETEDWRTFPKVFHRMDWTRENIREGFGKAIYADEYASAREEDGTPLQGEILSQLPTGDAVLPCYLRWAEKSIRAIEESIGLGIVEAFARACAIPACRTWEEQADEDNLTDAETFGHYLAMQFVGHGVSWEDSHPALPFQVPHGEGPSCFLTGEINLADLETGVYE